MIQNQPSFAARKSTAIYRGEVNRNDQIKKAAASGPISRHHHFPEIDIKDIFWSAALAQWIHRHLPSCCPGFESQAHNQRFNQFILDLCHAEKTKKEAGIGPFLKTFFIS